ncbi:hypothetical protein J8273_4373 [Carpediemonas membranifera]|uniref:Uncharacterized protein n=1 Tax=Carpediemonas membranifera TaxID=201153 RepID=A0A8J6E2F6_9EUKA|nr:hypothetical protein J8273_4373 [Carpediemonas membranifera]|eukprot:KAG9394271.1 hypothetical protein J8273_4373 [Carpediemonas membranifera]
MESSPPRKHKHPVDDEIVRAIRGISVPVDDGRTAKSFSNAVNELSHSVLLQRIETQKTNGNSSQMTDFTDRIAAIKALEDISEIPPSRLVHQTLIKARITQNKHILHVAHATALPVVIQLLDWLCDGVLSDPEPEFPLNGTGELTSDAGAVSLFGIPLLPQTALRLRDTGRMWRLLDMTQQAPVKDDVCRRFGVQPSKVYSAMCSKIIEDQSQLPQLIDFCYSAAVRVTNSTLLPQAFLDQCRVLISTVFLGLDEGWVIMDDFVRATEHTLLATRRNGVERELTAILRDTVASFLGHVVPTELIDCLAISLAPAQRNSNAETLYTEVRCALSLEGPLAVLVPPSKRASFQQALQSIFTVNLTAALAHHEVDLMIMADTVLDRRQISSSAMGVKMFRHQELLVVADQLRYRVVGHYQRIWVANLDIFNCTAAKTVFERQSELARALEKCAALLTAADKFERALERRGGDDFAVSGKRDFKAMATLLLVSAINYSCGMIRVNTQANTDGRSDADIAGMAAGSEMERLWVRVCGSASKLAQVGSAQVKPEDVQPVFVGLRRDFECCRVMMR